MNTKDGISFACRIWELAIFFSPRFEHLNQNDGKLCRYARYGWGANLRPPYPPCPVRHLGNATRDSLRCAVHGVPGWWDVLGRFIIEPLQYGELVHSHKDTNKIIAVLNLSKHHAKAVFVFWYPSCEPVQRNDVWLLEMGSSPSGGVQVQIQTCNERHPFQTRWL